MCASVAVAASACSSTSTPHCALPLLGSQSLWPLSSSWLRATSWQQGCGCVTTCSPGSGCPSASVVQCSPPSNQSRRGRCSPRDWARYRPASLPTLRPAVFVAISSLADSKRNSSSPQNTTTHSSPASSQSMDLPFGPERFSSPSVRVPAHVPSRTSESPHQRHTCCRISCRASLSSTSAIVSPRKPH